LPGPHREARLVRSAAGGDERRRAPDRDLRDAAGGLGLRPLLLPSRSPLLHGGQDRPRPGPRLPTPERTRARSTRALAGPQPDRRPGVRTPGRRRALKRAPVAAGAAGDYDSASTD